jgi:hypothetical protein
MSKLMRPLVIAAVVAVFLMAGCVQICTADTLGSVSPVTQAAKPASPGNEKRLYPNPMYLWHDDEHGVTCYLPVQYDNKGPMSCFLDSEFTRAVKGKRHVPRCD